MNNETTMTEPTMTTLDKAHRINLNPQIYGTFAEIGAGQEVARHFFVAGKASQTIAKTISAYDMTFSDEIYGREKNGRYVCEPRLGKMLNHEFSLLQERLSKKRGATTQFFAFANTVATGSADLKKYCHGWMGVRFQTRPGGAFNEIILHVRMQDRFRLQQQEALGVLGVNLVDAAFYHSRSAEGFIPHLVENLRVGQLVIDVLKFAGEDLRHFNPHLMNLELVQRGLAEAILFSPQQEILHVSDTFYKKALLLQRGHYRPVTNTHMDVLSKGLAHFKNDFQLKDDGLLPIMEITMHGAGDGRAVSAAQQRLDYLERIEMLCALGYHVLVSNFFLFYTLKTYLRQYTQEPVAIVLGASHLERVFDETRYKDLSGGLLEGLGKLLDSQTKLYVYPHKTEMLCLTAKSFFPAPHLRHIYTHFQANNQICDIAGCDETEVYMHSNQVYEMIKNGDPAWEKHVPASVAAAIKARKLVPRN